MYIYSAPGANEFIICPGYKGYLIKEYFINYFDHLSNNRVDIAHNTLEALERSLEPWSVTASGHRQDTMTGGWLKRVRDHMGD